MNPSSWADVRETFSLSLTFLDQCFTYSRNSFDDFVSQITQKYFSWVSRLHGNRLWKYLCDFFCDDYFGNLQKKFNGKKKNQN
jgi:hypothetical protein